MDEFFTNTLQLRAGFLEMNFLKMIILYLEFLQKRLDDFSQLFPAIITDLPIGDAPQSIGEIRLTQPNCNNWLLF